MAIKIRTDNQWHDFVYRYDVPASVLADQFDWLDEDTDDGFFRYRGYWYHLSQFERTGGSDEFKGWDGYQGDSYFSGILIKVSGNVEQYKVGTYTS